MAKYLNLKPVEFDALGKKTQAAFVWAGRILLPKYDGCFAMVGFFNGKPDFILSRTGEAVKSMDHIYEDILVRYPMLASLPGGLCLLGEAWMPGKDFAEISGTFRRQRAQAELGFALFDQVSYRKDEATGLPLLFSSRPYEARVSELCLMSRKVYNHAYPPLPIICESKDHAERYARNLKDMGGYDGAICSDPDAPYVPGAGKAGEFIKIKPLQSFSLLCVGVERSTGEKTGRDTCALVTRFKGTTCKVGTGLSESQQANPEQFVGKIIEVACMGVYPGDDGLMREPRFVGVRDDVTQADF